MSDRNPLRVGVIAPPWLPVPPTGYGGTEAVIDALCRGLAGHGHDVILVAPGDSTCPVTVISTSDHAPGIDAGGSAVELDHVVGAYDALAGFGGIDIIHDHTVFGPLYGPSATTVPIVTTNHNRFVRPWGTGFRALGSSVPTIAISRHHAASASGVDIGAIIHHGVDPLDFPFGDGSGGFALFLGRMVPAKGAHRAIRAARDAGWDLVLAGKAQLPEEIAYVEEEVLPHVGATVRYLGETDRATKVELLASAGCLLNPIAWDEPFGMVMIEALACGTPVVTLDAGAAPEIVVDGVTGFVAHDEAGLVAALGSVRSLDRKACRAAVEGHFSVDRMVAEHVAFYDAVIAAHPARSGREG
jgi:glycosyltransferase involved in cell wall biosynthesis